MTDREEISDGYHTFKELYRYRMLYNAHAALGWQAVGIPVVRSRRHHDGEPCFDGEYFIVVATLPTGQVSNHYKLKHWDVFDGILQAARAPEWDGHTPAEAADRIARALPEIAARTAHLYSDARWLFGEFGWDHWRECDVPKDEDGGCPCCNALEEMKDRYGW